MQSTNNRWHALDILRGLSIIFMLLALNPGAWEHVYPWLIHAKWQGGTFIDMVAPTFLFCIGAAIPLSLAKRVAAGEPTPRLVRHIVLRGLFLVLVGLVLNAYPAFDFDHLRIPGVLQRIGLCYILVALFILFTGRRRDGFQINATAVAAGFVFVLIAWFTLLYFVPVPGFGAPRFDPIGSWPAYLDRAVFTTSHMFIYWPVDGQIVFDPDGLLSTFPVCANVLFGSLITFLHVSGRLKRPIACYVVGGAIMIALAVVLNAPCPIIKNIWTSTFILFTCGFALVSLAILSVLIEHLRVAPLLFPATVYGSNPLLAYILSFLIGPLIDLACLRQPAYSLRHLAQIIFQQWFSPNLSSFLVGCLILFVIFVPLYICYRLRWFLRL